MQLRVAYKYQAIYRFDTKVSQFPRDEFLANKMEPTLVQYILPIKELLANMRNGNVVVCEANYH